MGVKKTEQPHRHPLALWTTRSALAPQLSLLHICSQQRLRRLRLLAVISHTKYVGAKYKCKFGI
jgi:hypothetical protein